MAKTRGSSKARETVRLPSRELVVLAVSVLGGDCESVDTEDIAKRVNDLAPGRFTWVKYPDQINIELVRTYLSDAKKPKNGALLAGTGKNGWKLTAAGNRFVTEKAGLLNVPFRSERKLSSSDIVWIRKERKRLLASDAYVKHKRGDQAIITRLEVEALFRLDEYITGDLRRKKIDRMLAAFQDDAELGDVVKSLADQLWAEDFHVSQ